MAGRGRPPKPTAIKELEGNPGKRLLNKNEPKPKKVAPNAMDTTNEKDNGLCIQILDGLLL